MRLAFIIERRNYYRTFATAVDAALKRGWRVDCWHDWAQPPAAAPNLRARAKRWIAGRWPGLERAASDKSSEFPNSAPLFHCGTPRVLIYHGKTELLQRLAESPPDAVFAAWPPPSDLVPRIPWITLQHMMNLLYLGPKGLAAFDHVACSSRYWLDRSLDYFRRLGELQEGDSELATAIAKRYTAVGVPELDQTSLIDPASVRARLGLDADKPVVLYLPYPRKSNPQTFWVKHVYGTKGRLWGLAAVLATGRHGYWRHVVRGWNDAGAADALRAFCDANDALLIVKSRRKDPVSRHTAERADRVLYDESYYPATILELLSIASLCVHFFSSTAYEALFLGVPSLCVTPSAEDMGLPPVWMELLNNTREGGVFNFPGASYHLSLPELVEDLPRRSLKDFPVEPAARARFLETFVGFDDTRSSERLLDLVAGRRETP
ncbi:MAG TPA: hypothetical protein VMS64_23175 [Candidatus Methylomirabilis sp.]|nr:hypothetical protein [Candidatus Methylomirabilis sp.]